MSLAIGISLAAIVLLASFDLWIGVANDAVNFLNSAIGAEVAKRRTIILVAALGVLIGALTSSGLMEVARRGVFDPDRFVDPTGMLMVEAVLAIYLGVMASDVLLLDLFNTLGLPTSTTVSIISELVGASIAVALWMTPGDFWAALTVIQTGPVLGIYSGIFLSVLVAFTVSALIMLVVRLIYTHDIARTFPSLGWLWIGFSFVALTYFVLFKGLSGARVLSPGALSWIQANIVVILGVVFAVSASITVVLRHRYELVLKFTILVGTGALGLAFAGNDLVNFIGPSVAAAQAVFVEGVRLSGRVETPAWALVLAGIVMTASLYASEKASRVTDTEIRLAAHGGRKQRFSRNPMAAGLVRMSLGFWDGVRMVTPPQVGASSTAGLRHPSWTRKLRRTTCSEPPSTSRLPAS